VAGRVGVLALQGAFREHSRALADVGLDPVEVRQARDLAGLAGLVIPGGEYDLEAPIRELYAAGAPIMGTCAGMIVLSAGAVDGLPDQRYLGLIDLTVRRNAFGRQVASFEAPLRIGDDPAPLTGVFIRAPWIERVGDGVEVLAEHEGHPVAAAQGSVLVTAFHPELTDDRRLHRRFADLVERGVEVAA
jgi:5'-phosphate synthase pdxT subunit